MFDLRPNGFKPVWDRAEGSHEVGMHFSLFVENASLVAAKGVRVGAIYWTLKAAGQFPHALRAHLDLSDPPQARSMGGGSVQLHPALSKPELLAGDSLAPFDLHATRGFGPRWPDAGGFVGRVAVFVLAEGAVPDWYEITVESRPSAGERFAFSMRRCYSDRPRVSWEAMPDR